MKAVGHFIAGGPVAGASGRASAVFDPATGEVAAEVSLASTVEVDSAVGAAREAFEEWSSTSLARRTRLMFNFRQLVSERADELAELITAEHGKVLADSRGEIARGLENIEYACGVAEVLKGDHNESVSNGVDVLTVHQPLGVVAGITPFNFPVMVPLWMIPNAVACGNTFVLKPSERDPSAPMLLAEIFRDAGFPPGVLNVVNGGPDAVDSIVAHPDVDAVSFVGSTPVARHVHQMGNDNGKRVQALGGAKNHMVVLPDADIEAAAEAAVSAAFGSAGERCMAISVVAAVEPVGDALVEAIRHRIEHLTVGPGADPASQMGPLITAEARSRVAGYVAEAVEQGADIIVDGRSLEFAGNGFFIGPTLLDRVTDEMDCYRDEIFGPVLSVVRCDSYQDGVDLIAKNPWGNGAAIFTQNGGAARRFQRDAKAGMVGINVAIPVPAGSHSFGGWKDSFFGDTPIYGPAGMRFYTRSKVITSRWSGPSPDPVDLGFPTNQ